MGEVKRYTRDGKPDSLGPRIDFADYARLEREHAAERKRKFELSDSFQSACQEIATLKIELTRLRAVEAAANRVCDEADATGTPGWPSVQKLAEACGRKG